MSETILVALLSGGIGSGVVGNAVEKGIITAGDFKEITGADYSTGEATG